MQFPIYLMNRGHCVTAVYANYSSLMSYYSRCNSHLHGQIIGSKVTNFQIHHLHLTTSKCSSDPNSAALLLLVLFPWASNSVMSLYLKWLWAGHRDRDETIQGHLLLHSESWLVKEKLAGRCWVQTDGTTERNSFVPYVFSSLTDANIRWMSFPLQRAELGRISLRFCLLHLNTKIEVTDS